FFFFYGDHGVAASVTFPASDLDQPGRLLAALGSFWSQTYAGSKLVADYLHARAQLDAQNHLDLLHTIAALSRLTVPVFRTQNWYFLQLRETQRNQTSENLPKHDGTFKYEQDSGIAYGQFQGSVLHAWPVPPDLAGVKVALNRISDASLTMTHGLDFFIRNQVIHFRDNPFANDLVPKREIFQGDKVVDRECGLWLYRGEWEWNSIAEQFGYVLGLKLRSSSGYLELINAAFDALVEGSTQRSLQQAFATLCDVSLVKEPNEVVEQVFKDERQQWVVTDRHAYAFNSKAAVTVQVGQTVKAGDALTDTLQFFEFNRGQVPSELRALAMGKGLAVVGFFSDLVFENKQVPLKVIVPKIDGGFTRVEFEIGGWPGDVAKFWDDVHASGIAKKKTLAMLLDQRPIESQTTQPGPLALPATINPLGFLLQNVFRNGLLVVKAKPAAFGSMALGLHHATLMRKLMPPQTALVLFVELAVTGEEVKMEGIGDDKTPGYEEKLRSFAGMNLDDSIDPAELIEERIVVRLITGRCE
ncbi:MAG: hypothetical protein L0312_00055, partial [Acidobacteria bacterium]|nr:hypothetical protein [Acidobacteriota bacterium]